MASSEILPKLYKTLFRPHEIFRYHRQTHFPQLISDFVCFFFSFLSEARLIAVKVSGEGANNQYSFQLPEPKYEIGCTLYKFYICISTDFKIIKHIEGYG